MRFKCVYCEAITSGDRCRNCGAARYEHGVAEPALSGAGGGMAAFSALMDANSTRILTSGRGVRRAMLIYPAGPDDSGEEGQ